MAHTYMCLEEKLERIFFLVVGDDDGQWNQPFHGWWANNLWNCHEFAPQKIGKLLFLWPFRHQPKPTLQQNPSSLQSLCVVGSTTTTKNTKFQKSQKHHPLPTKQIYKHPTKEISPTPNKSNCTNTQLNNPKTTRQEKFHKHPTRDLKLTNTKSKSTKHPTKREFTTTQQEIWSLRF